jgi:PRTRC genetic system protein E
MVIRKHDGELTIQMIPVLRNKDKVKQTLSPLTVTGAPEELDKDFFSVVASSLEKTKGITNNIKQYEALIAAAEEEKKKKALGKKDKPKTTQPATKLESKQEESSELFCCDNNEE